MRFSPIRLAARLAALVAVVSACAAQQDASTPAEPIEPPVRPEVSFARPVYGVTDPVVLRLTLINDTRDTIEIDAGLSGESQALRLSDELLYGTPESPALTVAYEGESAQPLFAPRPTEPHPALPLQIGPYSTVGAAIDLRAVFPGIRYSGAFTFHWRPFGDAGPSASASVRIEPRKRAVIVTDYGKLTVDLAYDTAPHNVENFLSLARQRFYDGLTFHRIIPQFIIQGGSPDASAGGVRPDGAVVPAEFSSTEFIAGTVAMARKPSDPDSASCQFFVSLGRNPELDRQYTVIGHARDDESLMALKQIAAQPTDVSGRPLRPVVIRFVTLVDADPPRVERLRTARP